MNNDLWKTIFYGVYYVTQNPCSSDLEFVDLQVPVTGNLGVTGMIPSHLIALQTWEMTSSTGPPCQRE